MADTGIPYVFQDGEEVYSAATWLSNLKNNSDAHEKCFVKAVTIVKNLYSDLQHEYLQIIIERTDTNERVRLLAERQTAQDQVIVGRQNWNNSSGSSKGSSFFFSGSSGSTGGDDDKPALLPLPLLSLKFDKNNFGVVDLARILETTSRAGGRYNLLTRNCYWFARTVYNAIAKMFQCKSERWWAASWQGFFILWKSIAKPEARKFDQMNQSTKEYTPGGETKLWRFYWYMYDHALGLKVDPKADPETISKIKKDELFEWVANDVEKKTTMEALEKFQDSLLKQFGHMEEDCDSILSEDGAKKYIAIFDSHKQHQSESITEHKQPAIPDEIEIKTPSDEQRKKTEKALKILVGFVIDRLTEESEKLSG